MELKILRQQINEFSDSIDFIIYIITDQQGCLILTTGSPGIYRLIDSTIIQGVPDISTRKSIITLAQMVLSYNSLVRKGI